MLYRTSSFARALVVILASFPACGDDDAGGGGDSATVDTLDTSVASETSVTETTVTEATVSETIAETTITETAVGETGDDVAADAQAEVAEDVTIPPVCLGRAADRAEGLYRAGSLVTACGADERCNKAGDACVAARCFAAETGFVEGVYELDGDARGERLDRCLSGYRCDDDGTPYCERVPGVGLPIGFACAGDLECAGIDGFEGRCVTDPGGHALSEGRCGHGCGAEGDCPGGAHCAFLGSDDPVCVADCPAFVPCPGDAYCQDGDDDGREECLPPGVEPIRVGGACVDVEDCAGTVATALCVLDGDVFWKGGYCVQLRCLLDADCVAGSHCGFFGQTGTDTGVCVADCGAGGACERAGQGCWDVDVDGRDECMPAGTGAGAIGAPCTSIEGCGGGAGGQCWIEASSGVVGGYCTKACSDDDACPEGSLCQGRGSNGAGACMTACDEASDCPESQACFDRDRDDRAECGRRGVGATPQNVACTSAAACGTGPRSLCLGGANFPSICTAECASDDECTGASHCVMAEGRGVGFCLPTCTVGGDPCPAGSGCVDFDVDGRDECGPSAFGAVPLGERCTLASDCAAGDGVFCGYPDLVCTRFCEDDASCGSGGRCVRAAADETRICRRACTSDATCGAGMRCLDIDASGQKECVVEGSGLSPVGGACAATSGCADGLVCRGSAPGGVCTRGCGAGVACPSGSRCAALDGGPDVCLATCTTDGECRQGEGWACFDGDDDGAKECRPFGGGDRELGDACVNVTDCAGGAQAVCATAPATFSGTCTRECADDASCGVGNHCVAVPQTGPLCFVGCASDDDCRELHTCADIGGTGMTTECAYTCASNDDCRGFRGSPTCSEEQICEP